jgi:hypothetical protein
MKIANIMLAIGGGRDNTIPKYNVTAGEIAVLRAIHGEDAVFDVEPLAADALNEDGKSRTNRQELGRLKAIYGKAQDSSGAALVEGLYPGAAARVFETVDELELPAEYFKATGRVASVAPEPAAPKAMTKAELIAYAKTNGIEVDEKATAKAIAAAIEAAETAPADDEDDLDAGEGDEAAGEPEDGKDIFQ